MRILRRLVIAASVTSLAAGCSDRLAITNPNTPDRSRALARPQDIENFLASSFNSIHNATLGAADNLNTSFQVMSFENFSNLANFNMSARAALPRAPIDNSRGNAGAASMNGPWFGLSRAARTSSLVIEQIRGGQSLGDVGRDWRARAYGWFNVALANGMMAAAYDTVGIVQPGAPAIPVFATRQEAATAAFAAFDSSLAALDTLAARAPTTVIPAVWLNVTTGDQNITNFRRIVRSFRARVRLMQPRTAAENAAVNWAAVRDDAQNGITANLELTMNGNSGWPMGWIAQNFAGPNWHVMTPFIIGMADTTGRFANWLNSTLASRSSLNPDFVSTMFTYDNRFPAGATRSAQQAAPGRYFGNRTADGDANDGGWGFSAYSNIRFQAFNTAGRVGPFPVFTLAERNLILAEALIRLNQAGGGALVAVSRSAAGLSDVSALNAANDPVGTVGNQCVPRVPSTGGTLSCPTLLEALKWEKRMETQFTTWGSWYFDSRRWGDLPAGTPVHFPVPVAEIDTRPGKTFWNGRASDGTAGPGTYGY
jgi:hypothetical protein